MMMMMVVSPAGKKRTKASRLGSVPNSVFFKPNEKDPIKSRYVVFRNLSSHTKITTLVRLLAY